MSKTYRGYRTPLGTAVVIIIDDGNGADNRNSRHQRLRLRLDLFNHSPTGFEWNFVGSGPAQLALALLADCIGDDELAGLLCQEFKFDVVAKLPPEKWELTEQQIKDWANKFAGEVTPKQERE